MKVEYVNQAIPIRLEKVNPGEVFRPTNSQHLYIATDRTALDNLFTDDPDMWYEYIENPQNIVSTIEYGAFGDWVACYDIDFKTLCVMHCATEVYVLNATLQIEN